MALEDILQRFRRIWSPPGGPAGPAGVPADQQLELATELGGVLAALDAIEAEAGQILDAAGREAAALKEAARSRADLVTRTSLRRAERERVRAAERRRSTAAESARGRLEQAEKEAQRIREVAGDRERALVAEFSAGLRAASAAAQEGGDLTVAVVGSR